MPVPVAPDVIVRNEALLAAVQAQVEAAVTGSVPVEAAPLTLVVTVPSVTLQELVVEDGVDGVEVLLAHAAANATAEETTVTSSKR